MIANLEPFTSRGMLPEPWDMTMLATMNRSDASPGLTVDAIRELIQRGSARVYLRGGFDAWVAAGFPVMKRDAERRTRY